MNVTTPDDPAPGITVDGTGLLCVTLMLRLRKDTTAPTQALSSTSSPLTSLPRSTCPPGAT
ncbi:hypothetical protein [Streptomyces peucetius]